MKILIFLGALFCSNLAHANFRYSCSLLNDSEKFKVTIDGRIMRVSIEEKGLHGVDPIEPDRSASSVF